IGLRVYGHNSSITNPNCEDTRLEIDFCPANIITEKMKVKLAEINARGTTPIGQSLLEGAKDLQDYKDDRNIIILITDGKEECGIDPCTISLELQKKGIILKPFVIGVGDDENDWKTTLGCVGRFFDAQKEEDFTNILKMVVSHILDKTTTQVNLLSQQNLPTETDITLTFYNNTTGKAKYNYVHKINSSREPDTMVIDPVICYNIVAHTTPPVSVDSVIIRPGKHNTISLKTPQGKLKVNMNSKTKYNYIIRNAGVDTTLHVQEINTVEDYIVGDYEIELLSIPRYKKRVHIGQDSTSIIQVPTPALANIHLPSKGFGGVYFLRRGNWEQVWHFRNDKRQYKLTLLPGTYKVVFRANSAKEYIYTHEKKWDMLEGKSKFIKIY
ncbi:VWA domain-containing protein, partial [Flavobacteriales bacterium]|nr:VWA domain-containing protein [Flavobacteriales bacterium]